MQAALAPADQEAQRQFRDFIDRHFPPAVRDQPSDLDIAAWHAAVDREGWATPRWPPDWGGTGWAPVRQYLWERETALAGCPRRNAFAVDQLAPVLLAKGSPALCERELPGIARGTTRWCQAFWEAGATHDAEAVQTRADRRGQHYFLTGEKHPVAAAGEAQRAAVLARTAPGAAALSLFLADLRGADVVLRALSEQTGDTGLWTLDFRGLAVPAANRVGAEGEGLECAALAEHPRVGLTRLLAETRRTIQQLQALQPGDAESAGTPIAEAGVELLALEAGELRLWSARGTGLVPAGLAEVLRLRAFELRERLAWAALEALGYEALPAPQPRPGDNEPAAWGRRRLTGDLLRSIVDGRWTMHQRDLLARKWLGND